MGSDRRTPVMQLAISEGLLEVPNPATLAKRLSRGLLKDISDQADYTLLSWPYEDLGGRARTDAFRVTLATSIDPFAKRRGSAEIQGAESQWPNALRAQLHCMWIRRLFRIPSQQH